MSQSGSTSMHCIIMKGVNKIPALKFMLYFIGTKKDTKEEKKQQHFLLVANFDLSPKILYR